MRGRDFRVNPVIARIILVCALAGLSGGVVAAQETAWPPAAGAQRAEPVHRGLSIEEKLRLGSEGLSVNGTEVPDDPDKALGCGSPCTSGSISAMHPYYDVFLNCSDGSFTARTGSAHPVTINSGARQNVIFGGASGNPGTSDISFYVYDSGSDYVDPTGGAACQFDPPDTFFEPDSTGLEAEWTRTPMAGMNLTFREEIVAFGDTVANSGIRLTLGVTNDTSSTMSATVGVRWQIDYQNAGDDGPGFSWVQCEPFSIGPETFAEHQFDPGEIQDFYRIRNNANSPIFENFTSTRSLPGFPDTYTPDRLVYGYWPSMVDSPWGYVASEGSPLPDVDSAVLYYYGYIRTNALLLQPGESATRSVILFTSGEAQECSVFYECAAVAGLDAEICEGDTGGVDLDGSTSTFSECPGTIEYRWLDGAAVVQDWSTDPTVTVHPAATTTYTLEFRCIEGTDIHCESSDDVMVIVHPLAAADAGPDAVICSGDSVDLDGSGSAFPGCSGDQEYQWLESGTPVRPWSTDPIFTVSPSVETTYTLEVRCSEATGLICGGTDDTITVAVHALPTASAGLDTEICAGDGVDLDGSGSRFPDCTGDREYQWLEGGTPVRPWSTDPGFTVSPSATTTYTLEVRCSEPGGLVCTGLEDDAVTVTVHPIPVSRAGDDITVCETDPFQLDGAGSVVTDCQGVPQYRWSRGGTPLTIWQTLSSLSRNAGGPGVETYLLEVRCNTAPACVGSDEVAVIVEECPTPVEFLSYGATSTPEGVAVSWVTLAEHNTLGFVVEGRNDPTVPAQPAHRGMVAARGSGSTYTVLTDPPAYREYRIREVVSEGTPSTTPFFPVQEDTARTSRPSRRSGSR